MALILFSAQHQGSPVGDNTVSNRGGGGGRSRPGEGLVHDQTERAALFVGDGPAQSWSRQASLHCLSPTVRMLCAAWIDVTGPY